MIPESTHGINGEELNNDTCHIPDFQAFSIPSMLSTPLLCLLFGCLVVAADDVELWKMNGGTGDMVQFWREGARYVTYHSPSIDSQCRFSNATGYPWDVYKDEKGRYLVPYVIEKNISELSRVAP